MLKHIIFQICFLAGWTPPRLRVCFTRGALAFCTLRPRPDNAHPGDVWQGRRESRVWFKKKNKKLQSLKRAIFKSPQQKFNQALLVQQLWQSKLTQEDTLSRTRLGGVRWRRCRHLYRPVLIKSGDDSLFLWAPASDSITAALQASDESRKWGGGKKGIKDRAIAICCLFPGCY